jgi:hypothetical protein
MPAVASLVRSLTQKIDWSHGYEFLLDLNIHCLMQGSLRAYLHDQFRPAEAQPVGKPNVARSPELPAPNSHVEFIRLPKTKGRDPLFGLSRSFLNQLILPRLENNYQPPVRSHVLRRRGHRTGIRLISVDSLRDYIKAHEEPPVLPVESTPGPASEQGDI